MSMITRSDNLGFLWLQLKISYINILYIKCTPRFAPEVVNILKEVEASQFDVINAHSDNYVRFPEG